MIDQFPTLIRLISNCCFPKNKTVSQLITLTEQKSNICLYYFKLYLHSLVIQIISRVVERGFGVMMMGRMISSGGRGICGCLRLHQVSIFSVARSIHASCAFSSHQFQRRGRQVRASRVIGRWRWSWGGCALSCFMVTRATRATVSQISPWRHRNRERCRVMLS